MACLLFPWFSLWSCTFTGILVPVSPGLKGRAAHISYTGQVFWKRTRLDRKQRQSFQLSASVKSVVGGSLGSSEPLGEESTHVTHVSCSFQGAPLVRAEP